MACCLQSTVHALVHVLAFICTCVFLCLCIWRMHRLLFFFFLLLFSFFKSFLSHLFFFSFLQPSVARLIDTSVIQEALKPGHFQVVIWACRRSPAVQFYRERTAQRLPVVYPYYPSIYAYAEQRDELYRLLMLGVEAHISAPPPDQPFLFNQAFVFKR